MTVEDYRKAADIVATEIAAGRLRPGDRLPPLRQFARQHGIANSTAIRVYRELASRGLTVGEVGRGTFVRATSAMPALTLTEPAISRIDLELSYPVAEGQSELLAGSLRGLMRAGAFESAVRPVGVSGTPRARAAAADLLARGGWRPSPQQILFAGNGRQALAAAIAGLIPAGGRMGIEELTYPVLKAIAGRVGITLVPVAADADGMLPDAVAAAHRKRPLAAIYLQPTMHNPLSLTMPAGRRADLAGLLGRLGIPVIEDAIWAFLRTDVPPFAVLVPDRTVVIDSLSKRLAPGLTAGFAVVPRASYDQVAGAMRAGGWGATRFAIEAATRWVADGTAAAVADAKRRDVDTRQEVAARYLGGFSVRTDPRSYYCWWELPAPWRADAFVAAAARRGVAVAPAAAFAVRRAAVPDALRVGLASPALDDLARALSMLADIARSAPDEVDVGLPPPSARAMTGASATDSGARRSCVR